MRFNPQAAVATTETDWHRPTRPQPMRPRVFRLVGADLAEVQVDLGLNDGSFTEVKAGELKEGDKVVVEQQSRGGPPRVAAAQRMPRM